QFPTPEAPLLTFLDTRGLDEPGYDPHEDLERFGATAHVVLVTVKALDHAQERVLAHLRAIHAAQPSRPIVLLLTCLHEGYPQQPHSPPSPFETPSPPTPPPRSGGEGLSGETLSTQHSALSTQHSALLRTLEEQRRRFEGLAGWVVPVDLTRPEEGFE